MADYLKEENKRLRICLAEVIHELNRAVEIPRIKLQAAIPDKDFRITENIVNNTIVISPWHPNKK